MIKSYPKPKTIKDKKYLLWLRKQSCVYSGQYAIEGVRDVVAAHDKGGGVALKDDDTKALPLLTEHHLGGQISEHNGYHTFWLLVELRTGKTREQLVKAHRKQYKESLGVVAEREKNERIRS